jgi:hypothetical protein
VETIDLSHWNTKDSLSVNESIWLAVGLDPLSVAHSQGTKFVITAEAVSKQQLLFSHAFEGYAKARFWVRAAVENFATNPSLRPSFSSASWPSGWVPVHGKSDLPGCPHWPLGTFGDFPMNRVGLLPTQFLEWKVWTELGKLTVDEFEETMPVQLDGDAILERDTFQRWLDHLRWKSPYTFLTNLTDDTQHKKAEAESQGSDDSHEAVNGRQQVHYLKVIAGLLSHAKFSTSETAAEIMRALEVQGVSVDRATLARTISNANRFRGDRR